MLINPTKTTHMFLSLTRYRFSIIVLLVNLWFCIIAFTQFDS